MKSPWNAPNCENCGEDMPASEDFGGQFCSLTCFEAWSNYQQDCHDHEWAS